MKAYTKLIARAICAWVVLSSFSEGYYPDTDRTSSPAGTDIFQPDSASIASHYVIPDWFRDAKFGIFIHWGVYSVPAYGNEWYARRMYTDGSAENVHHKLKWGDLTQFGYKDFIPMFKAERFNAARWARLFKKAGAKYVVPVAEHHDGFAMYNSCFNKWNSVSMGPHRDIVGELRTEVLRQGMHFGVSSHRAENAWFYGEGMKIPSDVRDTSISLYGQRLERMKPPHGQRHPDPGKNPGTNEESRAQWLTHVYELVDNYKPELLWFDWTVGFYPFQPSFYRFLAYYYNNAVDWNQGVVVNTKFGYGDNIQVFDIERGKSDKIRPFAWQTDTSVGKRSWGYIENEDNKTPDHIVDDLIDIVSKNGNLLLNIGPKPDGTITDEQTKVLLAVGKWLRKNGEGIYGTRPWYKAVEGDNAGTSGSMTDGKATAYNSQDIRFTTKDGVLYAFSLAWPENREVIIHSLNTSVLSGAKIKSVKMLGHFGKLKWEMTGDGLRVRFPRRAPTGYAHCVKIVYEGELSPCHDLSIKEAHDKVFPQYFKFRNEKNKEQHADYDTWAGLLKDRSGVISKYVNEEINVIPELSEWANRYAEEHPEKLVRLHLNGEARQIFEYPELLETYFPGHWVYMPGTLPLEDITSDQQTIKVKNAAMFRMDAYKNETTMPGAAFPHNVILVRLDEDGNKLWYESEYAVLASVDYQDNTITLERARFNSKPLSFQEGRTYIAPIACCLWGKYPQWLYNFSVRCPKDKNGKQAWQLFAEEIASWFKPDGLLHNVQGVAFDVNHWDVQNRGKGWDTDNDGKSDGGWDGETCPWREGDYKFLCYLRELVGDEILLTSDGQSLPNEQAVGVMDGIESEGLVQHNDLWRGVSRMINLHTYWQAHNHRRYDSRYVVLKTTEKNPEIAGRMRRFAAATSFCMGSFVASHQFLDFDFIPEQFRDPGSLGHIRGPLVRMVTRKDPVLELDADAICRAFEGDNCKAEVRDGKLIVERGEIARGDHNLRFKIRGLDLPKGDVTYFLEVRAIDPLEGFSAESEIPRYVWLCPGRLPDYGEGETYQKLFTQIHGLTGTQRPEQLSYYFRNTAGGSDDLSMELQGLGRMEITSLKVYAGEDILARKFENGMIITNPSLHKVKVKLSDIDAALNGSVEIPAVDAVFVK